MRTIMDSLFSNDPALETIIRREEERQRDGITLVASENYAYPEVHAIMGSDLANKYAEGYPGKRYYSGCTWVDQAENLAIERCKELFGTEHVNVQPHAGSSANMAALMALLKPGDTLMGMSLSSGGHLTHGHKVSFSGVFYNSVTYHVDPQSEQLNYTKIEELATKHRPRLIIAGASSYSQHIDFEKFHGIAQSVNAYLLADCAHTIGLIAAGLHQSPIPFADIVTATTHKTLRGPRGGFIMCKKEYQEIIDRAVFPLLQGGPFMNAIAAKAFAFKQAQEKAFKDYQKQAVLNASAMVDQFKELGYRIVSGGTETHLFVLDLSSKHITGLAAEKALEKAGIFVSRSTIPYDTQPPWIGSGIRIGTLALTTRGMKITEVQEIAVYVDSVLKKATDDSALADIKEKIKRLLNTL